MKVEPTLALGYLVHPRSLQALQGRCRSLEDSKSSPGEDIMRKVTNSTCLFGNVSSPPTPYSNLLPHLPYLVAKLYSSFKTQTKEFKLNFVSVGSPKRFLSRDLT
jgi:GDP-D-mannose dehydratase